MIESSHMSRVSINYNSIIQFNSIILIARTEQGVHVFDYQLSTWETRNEFYIITYNKHLAMNGT